MSLSDCLAVLSPVVGSLALARVRNALLHAHRHEIAAARLPAGPGQIRVDAVSDPLPPNVDTLGGIGAARSPNQ